MTKNSNRGHIVGGYDHSQMGKSLCYLSVCLSVGRSVVISRNQSVGKQSIRREEKSIFYVSVKPIQVIKDSRGHRPIYIPSEGLYTPKPISNLRIKSSRPIYPTTYLLYLSYCLLITSKTSNSSLSLK